MAERDRARESVLRVLTEGEKEGAHVYALLQRAAESGALSAKDRAFVRMLAGECIRRRLSLDDVIDRYAKTKKPLKPVIRNILRMGVCQILYLDRVTEARAVSSSVELARGRGFGNLTGFVNGVLRKVAAEQEHIEFTSKYTRYSVPQWIWDTLAKTYGEEETEAMARAFLAVPAVTLRLDNRLTPEEQDALAKRIAASVPAEHPDCESERHPFAHYALCLRRAGDLTALCGYQEGQWMVQDAAAMLAAECAGVSSGDTVIDVCAAPGGKALQLAEMLRFLAPAQQGAEAGTVYAFDLTEEKCDKIRENAARMRLDNVTVRQQDARFTDNSLIGQADVVLCDLPCSGLGVLQKKADIKYRLTEADITELAALQKEILSSAVNYLKDGGRLIYSTCTLTKEENEGVADFAEETLGLVPADLRPHLPAVLHEAVSAAHPGRVTILPGKYGTDGFFIAGFVKGGAKA
ncbi:MAG: 16S rRNA (cytosine(967)-C(5))-methyltransferase RsmB [Lachnospiraceae bacterium]|nr:16S rRNA (cytosine(967)-C(5))-methyltransferase RsmB [Lachnospiraceae bacterium]